MAKTRQLKTPQYKSFRMSKRVKHAKPQLPGSIRIFRSSLRIIKKQKKLFLYIVTIYLLLTIVMVKGFGISTGIADLKSAVQGTFNGVGGELTAGVALFATLLTSAGATANETASLYQSILVILTSLALIWTLRQVHAGKKTTTRDAFYKGMYPLVPFLLVLVVVCLQLIPLLIGSWLYSVVIAGGLALSGAEQAIWWIFIALLALISFYMLSSSVFALYIVTLPEMTPMKALRSAREIVRYRRWLVARRVLALPILLLLIGAVIMVPIIIFITPAAEWVFFLLNMAALAVMHSYMYSLYRELL